MATKLTQSISIYKFYSDFSLGAASIAVTSKSSDVQSSQPTQDAILIEDRRISLGVLEIMDDKTAIISII